MCFKEKEHNIVFVARYSLLFYIVTEQGSLNQNTQRERERTIKRRIKEENNLSGSFVV